MAFRTQTATLLILLGVHLVHAQDLSFPVRHEHLRKGREGVLTFTENLVRWEENRKPEHSRSWQYAEIQRLELAPGQICILTYEDVTWQFGRDREFHFDHLPADLAARVHPFLTSRLDQRYLAHLADPSVAPTWEVPAKLLLGRRGSNGKLKVASDHIVFDGGESGESRTWKLSDITNVNTSDPFELTVTTIEGENRIQLKAALSEERYQDLWMRISQFHGLKVFDSFAHQHPPQ
jgi:hypothetical protein